MLERWEKRETRGYGGAGIGDSFPKLVPQDKQVYQAWFPNLKLSEFELKSDPTGDYNCIGWAVVDDRHWWEPDGVGGHYWPVAPPAGPAAYALAEYVRAYESLGYGVCASGELEPGYEKVALYMHATGIATHAARLLADGAWTSKLGRGHDIEHSTLDGLEGATYGTVAVFMRKAITTNH